MTARRAHDQQGQLLGEYDANGQAIREYVWMGSTPVAMFMPDASNAANPPVVYYIHTDHLNTPRVITDKAGNTRWRWLAEPFGTTAPEANPSGLGTFTFNLRFPGQYFDQETELSYIMNRDYDQSSGRYVQADPIGLLGGINTYLNVEANPLSFVEPSGLAPSTISTLLNTAEAARYRACIADQISKRTRALDALMAKLGANVPLTDSDQLALRFLQANRLADVNAATNLGVDIARGATMDGLGFGRGIVTGKAGEAALKEIAKAGYGETGAGRYDARVISTDPTRNWTIPMSDDCSCDK